MDKLRDDDAMNARPELARVIGVGGVAFTAFNCVVDLMLMQPVGGSAMKNFAERMKAAFVISLLVLPAALPARAQSGGQHEQELLKIQEEWAAARVKRDVAYLEHLYAKEFRIQSMNGSVVERDADIANFASGTLKPDFVRDEDMKVSVYGTTAIVTGIENVGGTYRGNYGEFSLRFINVFVQRDGRWQLVAHQSTQIPKKP